MVERVTRVLGLLIGIGYIVILALIVRGDLRFTPTALIASGVWAGVVLVGPQIKRRYPEHYRRAAPWIGRVAVGAGVLIVLLIIMSIPNAVPG